MQKLIVLPPHWWITDEARAITLSISCHQVVSSMSWKKPLALGILKVVEHLEAAFGMNERITMALVALIIVGLLLWAVLAQLPRPYRCQRCDYTTTNEIEALGHEREASLHRMVRDG